MDIINRVQQLDKLFSYEKTIELEESQTEICPFSFQELWNINEMSVDAFIEENRKFNYTIVRPKGSNKHNKAILLLHGLNEHSWKKYLPWAEYLTEKTGKPVILFPIAFHMNRTPKAWNNPRTLLPWVEERKKQIPGIQNSTFVNLILSQRLYQEPRRFYTSGRTSFYNVCQLVKEIKHGKHALFETDTEINLMSYSIGAYLSTILLMVNPSQIFSNSKLFTFCGGSIFSAMNANARDILDSSAHEAIQDYYCNHFVNESDNNDSIKKSYQSMVRPDFLQSYRYDFFKKAQERIRMISLKKDVVIPTQGIVDALGDASNKILQEWDFPFDYSHQWPFPLNSKTHPELIDQSFKKVFENAASFL